MSSRTDTVVVACTVATLAPEADESALFNYWGSETPPTNTEYVHKIANGTSTDLVPVETMVRNIRGVGLSHFNVDAHGFQILQHTSSILPPQASAVPDFSDQGLMHSTYWPEIVALVKARLGARVAVAINTTVRDIPPRSSEPVNADNPRADPRKSLEPFCFVHGDYTAPGARAHMRAMLPTFFEDNGCMDSVLPEDRDQFFHLRDEIMRAEEQSMAAEGVNDQWDWSGKNYNGPRWAMFSVWRPLEIVYRDPLGLMDPNTLFEGSRRPSYVPLTRMYKTRPGFEAAYKSENVLPLRPGPGRKHDWYYISEQRPEEVYAIKLFDSEAHKSGSTVAPFAAHSAFALAGQEDRPVRQSAEVRVIVVW